MILAALTRLLHIQIATNPLLFLHMFSRLRKNLNLALWHKIQYCKPLNFFCLYLKNQKPLLLNTDLAALYLAYFGNLVVLTFHLKFPLLDLEEKLLNIACIFPNLVN